MTTAPICARCEATVREDALWGLCPKCVLDQARSVPVGTPGSAAPNRRLGNYELCEQIGRGGMGVVYKAIHVTLHRTVALKLILDVASESSQARLRFAFEAETAARLDHPHIVPIYELGEADGHPFLAMKLIPGSTLRESLRSGELSLASAALDGASRSDVRQRSLAIVRLIAAVARAVHHAHENQVLHRDLKPSNILVDHDGQPHLTDFGLAKGVDGSAAQLRTESGTTLGTPCYMSPEQAANGELSAASDVYSLGAILFEMLTGQPPFKTDTVWETLRLVAEQPPQRPRVINRRVDQDLDTICLKCLEKAPQMRYATALDLAEDLERWLRSEPIRARRASLALRAGRWVKRNPMGAAAIFCLGLALMATFGLLIVVAKGLRERDNRIADDEFRFVAELVDLWKNTNKTHVVIPSSRLARLAGAPLKLPGFNPVHLTLAVTISHDPYGQAATYAPFIVLLEKRMEAILDARVLVDLRLYKFSADGTQAPVVMDEVDFQRLGPIRYIQAKMHTPGLQTIVGELMPKDGVIFARKGLGITNLAQVLGHCVAFAHTNATISFLSQALLAEAGVTLQDLSCAANLSPPPPTDGPVPRERKGPEPTESDSETYAHRLVVERVLTGEFDVGEAPSRHFEFNKGRDPGLIELKRFPVVSDVYVARPGLASNLAAACRQSMLSMTNLEDPKVVTRLRPLLQGFTPITDRDFDSLRSLATNAVRHFQTGSDPMKPFSRPPARMDGTNAFRKRQPGSTNEPASLE